MGDLLLAKVIACRDRIAKIRAALPSDPHAVLDDERLEAFISFNLFLLAQDAIDLAAHLVSERGLGIPASQREVFETLAHAGLISRDCAAGMAAMASLRNRIAHAYGDVDSVRLVREAPVGLDYVGRFLDEIGRVDTT